MGYKNLLKKKANPYFQEEFAFFLLPIIGRYVNFT
ncbi:Protein of unknown function [Bacillus toyonensis]|nr:Protein of unknown function [Bacillus toyonensis]